ncbi:hypothetical protein FA95DRAFT_851558 [Auriscalpium vulgare]|uniref:Uncharacterized protein n=1 Tax=Auriscalpium vulgare TaxID=40419 RepID=A0ACB8R967_9AGAM|nr:hypothetical protein FA95DRAFT_851558 [Auriscalpium vulgare]
MRRRRNRGDAGGGRKERCESRRAHRRGVPTRSKLFTAPIDAAVAAAASAPPAQRPTWPCPTSTPSRPRWHSARTLAACPAAPSTSRRRRHPRAHRASWTTRHPARLCGRWERQQQLTVTGRAQASNIAPVPPPGRPPVSLPVQVPPQPRRTTHHTTTTSASPSSQTSWRRARRAGPHSFSPRAATAEVATRLPRSLAVVTGTQRRRRLHPRSSCPQPSPRGTRPHRRCVRRLISAGSTPPRACAV